MHRTSTRYSKRSPSTKARQGPTQYPDSLRVGEGEDLRRKILQRTHSIASRSIPHSATTTTSSGTKKKSTPPGLESYYMPALLSSPKRSPSSLPPSPSQGHFPSPGPLSSSALGNHYRYSLHSSHKPISSPPNPPSKEREDVDITDYYSESVRPFSDLPNSPPSSLSSPYPATREEPNSVRGLDFGLQMLLAGQLFGTNGVPVIHRGQDRNALSSTFGSAGAQSHVHPSDGDIGEGLPIDSYSDRQRGVSFNMSVGVGDAETNDNASLAGFDISSGLSTTETQRWPSDAVKLCRSVAGEPSPTVNSGDTTNLSRVTLDPPYEADICDVELTSFSPRAGCQSTFTNFTPPHVFDAFLPIRTPSCQIKTVPQFSSSVF